MAKDGTVTVKITGDSKGLKDALDDSDGHLAGFSGKMGGVAQGIGKAFVGMGAAAGAFGVLSVKAFMESEQVAAQTAAVLKSTGGAAKVTGDHISGLAGQLSMLSGVDDEVVQSGENVLLTFTNVKNAAGKNNDIFDQATKSALDMSVALGTDLNAANIQLGKALNDPIKGVTALSKVGVSFTAQQKDQIKTLVAHGNTLGAQKIILKELSTEFGGSAKAAGETFAGAINKLKVQVGNFMEDVGAKLVPILLKFGKIMGDAIPAALAAVAPFFRTLQLGALALFGAFDHGQSAAGGFSGAMSTIGVKLREVWDFIQANVLPVFGKFVDLIKGNAGPALAALGAMIAVVVVPPFVTWAIATISALAPIIAITVAVSALAAGLVYAYQHFEGFRKGIDKAKEVVVSAFGAIQAVVETVVKVVMDLWDRFGGNILGFIKGTWDAVVEVFRGAFEIISGIFDLVKAILTGKWGEAWAAIKQILDGAWDLIFGVLRNALTNVIPTLFDVAKGLLSAAFGLIWNALKTVLSDAWDLMVRAIRNGIDGVVNFFRDLPGRIVGAAGDLFGFIRTKIEDANAWVLGKIGDLVGFFTGLPGRIANSAGDLFGFVKTKINDANQWVLGKIDDLIGYFKALPGRFASGVGNIFGFIKDSFIGAINFVIRKWNDLSFTIGGQKVFGQTLPSVTIDTPNLDLIGLAAGGPISGLALVGEKGPELFAGHGTIIPNHALGGSTVHYSISVTAIDPAAAQEAVINAIKEYERRNGQGWRAA